MQSENIILGTNLLAWIIDVVADILSVIIRPNSFFLAMIVSLGVSSGLTPIVYLMEFAKMKK